MSLFYDEDPQKRNSVSSDTWKKPGAAYGTSVAPIVPNLPNRPTPVPNIGVGAFTPDYGSLIRSDPGYMAAQNSGQLDLATAASQRRAMLQKLAIQYGGLPSGMNDQFGDIDAGTLALAGQNTNSDSARLQRQHASGIEQFKRALAARGALQSGDLGHGLDQAEIGRGEREYDLGNQFGNAAQTVVNDYVGTESRVRHEDAAALSAAGGNVYSNPANRPVDAIDIPLIPGSVEQYGQAVYQHPDGSFRTADGQPFAPPASASFAPNAPSPSESPLSGPDPQQSNMIWMRDPNTGQLVQVPAGYLPPTGGGLGMT